MGAGGAKIKLHANADSSDGHGKSVISAPLDCLGLTEEKFWELLARVRRAPLQTPADQPHIRVVRHEVTELGNGSFRVVDTVGGLSWGESQLTMTHSFDPARRVWKMEADHDLGWNEVPCTVYTRLLSNPLRVETWLENGRARVSGPALADGVSKTIEAVLRKLRRDGTVPVQAHAESLSGDGQRSAVTGPLDHLLSADQFWEQLELHYRAGLPLPFLTSTRVRDLPGGGFQVTQTIAFGVKVIHSVMRVDRARGVATVTYYDQSGSSSDLREEDKVQTVTTRLHGGPMRVEVWADVVPKRHGEEVFKGVIQGIMDKVAEEAAKDGAARATAPERTRPHFFQALVGRAAAVRSMA